MLFSPDKSEVLLVSRRVLSSVASTTGYVSVAGSNIKLKTKLKSLQVTLDPDLLFNHHVQEIVRTCNYHLRAFCHIRQYLDLLTANTVACSIVFSRLDYCNALLYNMLESNMHIVQVVQNNLTRAVVSAR